MLLTRPCASNIQVTYSVYTEGDAKMSASKLYSLTLPVTNLYIKAKKQPRNHKFLCAFLFHDKIKVFPFCLCIVITFVTIS